MDGATDYEILCRECDFRRFVSQGELYGAVRDASDHKLSISTVDR